MKTRKKPIKAVQFIADAQLIRFVEKQAKEKPRNSLVQLLNILVKRPRTIQDSIWWSAFLIVWVNATGLALTKAELIEAIANGAKLTKADAGRAVANGVKGIKFLADAIAQSDLLSD